MLIVLFTHIVMFVKLREQAVARKHTSTNEKGNQLQSISKRFVIIVCAFYVCLLPKTIISDYKTYYNWVEGVMSMSNITHKMENFATPLLNLNSCLNPLIYSKLHQKFLPGLRWVWRKSTSIRIGAGSWFTRSSSQNSALTGNAVSKQPKSILKRGDVAHDVSKKVDNDAGASDAVAHLARAVDDSNNQKNEIGKDDMGIKSKESDSINQIVSENALVHECSDAVNGSHVCIGVISEGVALDDIRNMNEGFCKHGKWQKGINSDVL